MKVYLKKAFALLICCAFLCCPVFADQTCSLLVSIQDTEKQPVDRFNVEVCPVTTCDGTKHILTSEFADLGISADQLDTELSPEQAEKVFQYIFSRQIWGSIVTTNQQGYANFGTLEKGIYLVFDRGDQRLTFKPYLVELPAQTSTGQLNNVLSEPKTVYADSHTIIVYVEWIDDNNAAGKRPENVQVTLLRSPRTRLMAAAVEEAPAGALPYRTVVLNEAGNWMHAFHTLPKYDNYWVDGSQVPDYTLVEIEELSEGFVICYEYTPSEKPPSDPDKPEKPDKPTKPSRPDRPSKPEEDKKLPQTGFQMLPIYALMGAGSVMVVLGMVDLCAKKEEP